MKPGAADAVRGPDALEVPFTLIGTGGAGKPAPRRTLHAMEDDLQEDAPLRLHVLGAMADDFEDWEHVLEGVRETKGGSLDDDAVQSELESLIDEGLVNAFALSPPGPEGRLRWTEPDRSRLREEWTYWFHPTEEGMRLLCDETGALYPSNEHSLAKLNPPERQELGGAPPPGAPPPP